MKSLIKKKPSTPAVSQQSAKGKQPMARPQPQAQAQCCAKVSRTVAGCHD